MLNHKQRQIFEGEVLKEKIKVLHILGSMNMGGIQVFLMNLLRHIDRDEIQFDFACMNSKNLFQEEIEQLGGRLFCVGSHKHLMEHRSKLYRLLDEDHYDYIHIHSGNSLCVIDSILVKLHGFRHKVIYHSHNSSHKEKRLHKIFKPFVSVCNDYFFACSEEAAQWMFSKRILRNDQYTIVMNGIDIEKFLYSEKTDKEVREELSLGDAFVVGHIGRIDVQKNHKFLLKVFREILKRKPHAKLLCLGKGPMEIEIKELTCALGIEEHVLFLGNRNDVPRILSACNAFVFPSVFEGFGIALLEAQASGLPCFASDVISDEVIVSPLIRKLSLEHSAEQWADEICKEPTIDRKEANQIVKKSKYGLEHTVAQISAFYKGNLTR